MPASHRSSAETTQFATAQPPVPRTEGNPSEHRAIPGPHLVIATLAALVVGGLLGSLLGPVTGAASAASATNPDKDIVELGVMPHFVESGDQPSPLVVDKRRNLGFAVGKEIDPGPNGTRDTRLVIHDLADFQQPFVSRFPAEDVPTEPLALQAPDVFRMAIDEETGRLLVPGAIGTDPEPCPADEGTFLTVYDYGASGGRLIDQRFAFMPCSGTNKFLPVSASIYTVGEGERRVRKLLLAGSYATEGWRFASNVGFGNNLGQPLIVRQLDLDKLYAATDKPDPASLDWEIDLRYSGCGRWEGAVVLLERMGPDFISYCWESQPVLRSLGAQGYVVRIPLGDDHIPDTVAGSPPAPNPTGPAGLPRVPSPGSAGLPPGVNQGAIILACQSGGFTGNPRGCAEAMATEAGRQADRNVAHVTGGAPPLPDPTVPPVDQPKFISNPAVRRIPALPGTVFPFADPQSRRVLLLTADSVNGNAVWAFDAAKERFIGLVTGGAINQPIDKTAGGYDAVRGRAYLLTSTGVLSAFVRHSPLPGGAVHDVVSRPEQVTQWRQLAVAPDLHRVFVTLQKRPGLHGYAVLQDDTLEPSAPKSEDPDKRTKQRDEAPGETEVDRSGAAQASGAHVLVTGGIPRAVNQVDPFCESPAGFIPAEASFEREQFDGSCFADFVVTKGNREYFLGYSDVDTGSATGASAEASGFFVPLTERPTEADAKNVGSCMAGTFQGMSGGGNDEGFAGYKQFCDGVQGGLSQATGEDARRGTQGGTDAKPGTGFPVPSAICNDFGGSPARASVPSGPRAAAFAATAACDADQVTVSAEAVASAGALPTAAASLVSVGRMTGTVSSAPSAAGQVTVATATAENVVVGPLTIGQVKSVAITQAKGRTGTAQVSYTRQWCGIVLGGVTVAESCVDPTSSDARALIDLVNGGLGRARINVPDAGAAATPGGYQAVVTKSEDARSADRAVNDDDSLTAAGLEVVVYNDGTEGRDRVIVQFAGVHSESRYGIIELPSFEIPDFPELALIDDPIVEALALAKADPARFETLAAIPASFTEGASSNPTIFGRIAPAPMQALADIFGWLRNNLREALLLFLFFAILALPAYLFLRRRAFERAMTGPSGAP